MKKMFLSIVTFVVFCTANAQTRTKGTFEITPKIGTSSYTEYVDDDSTQSISGAEFGATADYYFNDRWSLRSGFIFDKMGGKYQINTTTTYNDNNNYWSQSVITTTDYYEDKFYYLSIPINANWHFGSTRKWNLNFGLSPSFLTNAEVVENGTSYNVPNDVIESFQLGLSFGIGYKIGITEKFGILIDAQWFNGLTNINKADNRDISNAGFSFNLGGVFKL